MELWIRSQDKKRLVKIEHIYYFEDEFTNNELKHHICIGAYDLGQYKTKKRAIEVLDEIENIVKPRMEQLYTFVYQMPKE